MKIMFIGEFKVNEIEWRLLIDFIIGWIAFFLGAFFDPLGERFLIHHNQGLGYGQIIWCAFWGLYNIWTIYQLNKWKE